MISSMLFDETIVAVSTPTGPGGIGIVRLSGSKSFSIIDRLAKTRNEPISSKKSHTTTLAKIIDPRTDELIDEALITIMRSPNSYTREDIVEINCHSGAVPIRKTLEAALNEGARLAEPGEFTHRAFLSGRIDLTQAQAVMNLVQARSEAAGRAAARQADGHVGKKIELLRKGLITLAAELEAAIDFADEDIESISLEKVSHELKKIIKEIEELIDAVSKGKTLDRGILAAIIGRPNVGKSSLLNAVLMEDKAITSSQPGTTRDIVEARVQLEGIPVDLQDTAGWRDPQDDIEKLGLEKTKKAIAESDLVILVLDGSEPLAQEDQDLLDLPVKSQHCVTVVNKNDLPRKLFLDERLSASRADHIVSVSARSGDGIDLLGKTIAEIFGFSREAEGHEAFLASVKQENNLKLAKRNLVEADEAHGQGFGEEVVSTLIKEALVNLGEVIGTEVNEEIIKEIFNRFCVGK